MNNIKKTNKIIKRRLTLHIPTEIAKEYLRQVQYVLRNRR